MGTVKNGKKWAGACVNGKVVSGLVKNGLVFYRKAVDLYKRRIMVGDDLSGRVVYSDFPTGYYLNFPSDTNSLTVLIKSNGTNLIYENVIMPDYVEIASDDTSYGYYLYMYDYGDEMISGQITIADYDTFEVTNITENASYRHLFIEDENIRPVQVGDVITSNTKFYFTFPDDFSKKVSPQMMAIISAKYSDNSSAMNLWYSKIASTNNVYFNFYGMSGYSQENVYSTNSSGDVTTNISYKNLAVTSPITISAINNTDIAKYVLVDTTTLGA